MITDEERAVWSDHFEHRVRLLADADPVVAGGFARIELRAFRLSRLRGRD